MDFGTIIEKIESKVEGVESVGGCCIRNEFEESVIVLLEKKAAIPPVENFILVITDHLTQSGFSVERGTVGVDIFVLTACSDNVTVGILGVFNYPFEGTDRGVKIFYILRPSK